MSEVQNKLAGAFTVGQLIRELQSFDQDALVLFGCNYGDYHRTEQTLPVGDVDCFEAKQFQTSAYSQSGVAFEEADDFDDENWCPKCEVERTQSKCPKCGTRCVDSEGAECVDDDEDDDEGVEYVLLRS